jgi:hypothetical protein
VAATSESTVDVAAERGLPLLLGMHDDDAAKAAMIARHARTAAGAGAGAGTDRAATAHASAHLAYVADTVEEAEKALRATMPGWLARTGEYVRLDAADPARGRDLDAYLDRLLAIHPVGPPDHCVERLAGTLDTTGVRRLLLMVEGGGDPDLTAATIHRLGRDVLPALRRRRAG